MDLGDYLQSSKKSLFRFEYLQEFDVPEEKDLFRIYEATGKVEIVPMMQDWWNFLESKQIKGVVTQRVRFIKFPLTKYLEWELRIHLETVKHGDEIRVINEPQLPSEIAALGDFWLIDDSIALHMNYDAQGRYLGFQEVASQPYREAKQYLLNNSIPMSKELFEN